MPKTDLDKVINEINKKYGEGTIMPASQLGYVKAPRLKTGSVSLDLATNGGWPAGLMTEIYGAASSGKTTITFFTIAEAQKKGKTCVFIDCEDSFGQHNSDYVENCGVNLSDLIIIKTSEAEEVFDIIKRLLDSDTPPDLIVVDSVAAMMPKEDLEKEISTPTMATRARILSRGLGMVTSINKKTALIFINQIRSSMSMYGSPITTPGGYAMKHYMALKVQVSAAEPIVEGKTRVGHQVKFKVVKSKVGVPYREGDFRLFYAGYIDKYEEAFTLAVVNEIISRSGGWYEFDDEKVQGREAMIEMLKTKPKLYEKLVKKISEFT